MGILFKILFRKWDMNIPGQRWFSDSISRVNLWGKLVIFCWFLETAKGGSALSGTELVLTPRCPRQKDYQQKMYLEVSFLFIALKRI